MSNLIDITDWLPTLYEAAGVFFLLRFLHLQNVHNLLRFHYRRPAKFFEEHRRCEPVENDSL